MYKDRREITATTIQGAPHDWLALQARLLLKGYREIGCLKMELSMPYKSLLPQLDGIHIGRHDGVDRLL